MLAQQQVAEQIWNYLTSRGWSKQSVSALLGSMQSESGIIADRWESDRIGNINGGYGLVQWTPATKYINWAQSNGLIYQDVISQCKRLEWEVANSQQFYNPNMTFGQFTKSTQSPEALSDIFIRYYERPLNPNQPARGIQSRYWFELLKGNNNNNSDNQKGEEEMKIVKLLGTPDLYLVKSTGVKKINAEEWIGLRRVFGFKDSDIDVINGAELACVTSAVK